MNDSNTTRPILILIRGMPGSGKSFLATELQKTIGPEQVVLLDPDAIDYESQAYTAFTKTPFAQEVKPAIHPFRYLKTQAYDGITAGKIIVWNQPFTERGMFDRLIINLKAYAAERGITLPVVLVEVDIDAAAAKERVRRRMHEGGHGPSEATLDRRINDYQSYAGNGYETVTVQGRDDAATSVAAVQEALRRVAGRG